MNQPLPPFSCTYSPNVPELLQQLNCTLALSTYQANKVILISAKDSQSLIQLPRTFNKAMGLAVHGNQLAVATADTVEVFSAVKSLAKAYPRQPNTYDTLYAPRATYYAGALDLHDMVFSDSGLWAVNTRFSCIAKIDAHYSFTPAWTPDFITDLLPEDRCHLNGMCFLNEQPKYVSALCKSDHAGGWRQNLATPQGILIDIPSNSIIASGLAMPHSPRLINGQLYALLSATGELVQVDANSGAYQVVKELNGFARGLDYYNDYIFVGLSKIRTKSSTFKDLPIAQKSVFAGIAILHEPTGALVGYIKYENSVEEIYDVRVIAGVQRPGLMDPTKPEHRMALSLPDKSFWGAPKEA
jgi:uncharacterized protein (TIGR03032 family)